MPPALEMQSLNQSARVVPRSLLLTSKIVQPRFTNTLWGFFFWGGGTKNKSFKVTTYQEEFLGAGENGIRFIPY